VKIRAINLADPAGSAGLRRHERRIGAEPGPAGGHSANPPRCRMADVAFTAVEAPERPEPSATAAGGVGSIPSSLRRSGDASAT
jgi:hypothetical protein